MTKKLLVIFICLLLVQTAFPHYKAKYHVIVDTDGGTEDIRALCMLLASPAIEVIAVTTSEGTLDSGASAEKVSALLQRFGHQGIPLGAGGKEAVILILESIALEEMPVDFLALGTLTNLAAVFESEPLVVNDMRKIYWSPEGVSRGGLDYDVAMSAARMMAGAGLPIDILGSEMSEIAEPPAYHLALDTVHSRYAEALQEEGKGQKEVLLKEDCLPLYLLYPEYFSVVDSIQDVGIRRMGMQGSPDILPLMLEILDGDKEDKSIIFNRFPVDPDFFEEDVAERSEDIISNHGLREWKIVVLTNEFHEHLGIYSIIGAKMGLRAREYFNIGIDELTIESLAGNIPPVSCLNDGLQVSTGATLGHGTISVREGDPLPAARFTFKNSTIEIRLKENLRKEIREDVKKLVRDYGLESTEYWDAIRALALQYWEKLDRMEIFEIINLP